jgi:Leucine-rich repeat (LRR) protein
MLSDNSFTDELPKRLSRNRLEIIYNKFSGKIPAGVSSWRNLVVLDASNNLLDDTIPQEIAALPNLTTLLLANNKLSGKIPT